MIVEFSLEYLSESATLPPGFDANLRLELPEMLYELFEETIVEFGREPIALRKVSQAKAYQRLRGSPFRDSSSKEPAAANEAVFHAAPGLLVLDENQADGAEVIAELIRELGADIALEVRLRLGIRQGRATLERGSTFTVFTEKNLGHLVSRRSLISEFTVMDEASGEFAIDSNQLVLAAQDLFRPYISMALIASR